MQQQIGSSSSATEGIEASQRRPVPVYWCAIALALAALIGAASFSGQASNAPLDPICAAWDAPALAAVERLGANATGAAGLQANESQFRLRRARRNCREGWLNLACQDYRALTSGTIIVGRRELSSTAEPCWTGIVAERPKQDPMIPLRLSVGEK